MLERDSTIWQAVKSSVALVKHILKTRILTSGCQQNDSFRRSRECGRRLAFLICILTGFLKVMNILWHPRAFSYVSRHEIIIAIGNRCWLRRKRRHVGPLIVARQYEGWTLLPADCLIMHFCQRMFRAKKKYLSNAPSRVAYSRQCRRPIAIHFRVNIIGRRRRLLYTSWYMYAANDKVESSGKKDASATCTDKKMVPTECWRLKIAPRDGSNIYFTM